MVNDVRYYKFSGKTLTETVEFKPVDVNIDDNGVVVWEREMGERTEPRKEEPSGEFVTFTHKQKGQRGWV